MDERELEFDENEMAALEGQRLVVELYPDSGSEPEFKGFHASEPAGNLSGGNDSGSEASRLSDAAAAAAYRTTLICQLSVRSHGLLIHASGSSAYEIFARSSPMSCLPCWWRKPTGTMTRLLLH